ncbi:MAG: hypothetical protein Q9226_008895, partial [Calogaya cf. arnoldii]
QIKEEIPLASLQHILEIDDCSFCRLVSSTLKAASGKHEKWIPVNSKDVMCTIQVLPMEADLYGARELGVNFSKKELVDPNRMKFYRFSPASNMGIPSRGQSIHLPLIDIDLVKWWYRECLVGKCGLKAVPHKTGRLPKGFRVIDVQRYCIIDAEPGCQYIALSYVWGNVGGLQNLQRHRKDLERDEAIRDRIEYLPNTIKGAISFTRSIGVRYLWVDGLCIVQDDLEDKMNQITAMDQIYSFASLTLAATSGANANAGLSGTITRSRDFHQPISRGASSLANVDQLY